MSWNLLVRAGLLVGIVLLMVAGGAALDVNSSQPFRYFGDAVSNGQIDFQVNQSGHITVHNNLDLDGNNINNFFAGDPGAGGGACPSGQFVQSVNKDGSYTCDSASSGVSNEFVNRSGDTMTGNLNMTNNTINNVSTVNEDGNRLRIGGQIAMTDSRITDLQDPSNAQDAATKSYVDSNTEADTDNQNLSDVLAHGNVANDTINMSGNNIVGANDLELGASANELFITSSAGTNIARFNSGGSVEVRNGNFVLSSGNSVDFEGNAGNFFIGRNAGGFAGSDVTSNSLDIGAYDGSNEGIILGDSNGNAALEVNTGDEQVTVPNGNLVVDGGELNLSGKFKAVRSGGHTQFRLYNDGDANDGFDFYSPDDGSSIVKIHESGQTGYALEVVNEGIELSTTDGQIDFTGDNDARIGTMNDPNAGLRVHQIGGSDIIRFNNSGNVEIPSGNLDMKNNNIVNCNQINGVDCADIGTGSQNLSEVLAHGNVANQSINMNNHNISHVKNIDFSPSTFNGEIFTEGGGGGAFIINSETREKVQLQVAGTSLATYDGSGATQFTRFSDSDGDTYLQMDRNGPTTFYNSVSGNVMLRMNNSAGSTVEIPSGQLDMSNNNIVNVNALSVTQDLTDGNISNSITVDGTGTVYDTAISDQGTLAFDWADGEVADSLTVGSTGRVDGAFVTVGDALTAGNISLGQGIQDDGTGSVEVAAGTGLSQDSGGLSINTGVVPRKGQQETVDGYWVFNNNVTIRENLNVVGNITQADVQELQVNGSLLPASGFSGTFDVGSSSRQWRDAHLAGSLVMSGTDLSESDLDALNDGAIALGTETSGSYDSTSDTIADDGTISKDELGSGGTLGFDWQNSEVADSITVGMSGRVDGAFVTVGTALTAGNISLGSGIKNDGTGSLAVEPTDFAGNALADNSDSLAVSTGGIGTNEIATGGVGNVEIANDAVNGTQIVQNGASSGQVLEWNGNQWVPAADDDTADTDTDDQNLSHVLEHGNVANQTINMNSNRLNSVQDIGMVGSGTPSIETAGGGSDTVNIWDAANSQVITKFNEGGDVEVPNGDLAIRRADSVPVRMEINNTQGSGDADAMLDTESSASGENGIRFHHDGTRHWALLGGDAWGNSGSNLVFYDYGADVETLRLKDGTQNVEIPNGDLNLSGNRIHSVAGMNVTNTSSGTQIADFTETGVTLHQPLSVESSGAMSVANGIDLTDTSSNTIESYGALYLKTSTGGSPKDISLNPSGVVGVQSNLSMGNNHITDLADPDNPQDAATKSYVDSNDNAGTDNQDLSETLVHGNTANRSIDMGGSNNVTNTMKVSMGNGMKMVKKGGNLIISD